MKKCLLKNNSSKTILLTKNFNKNIFIIKNWCYFVIILANFNQSLEFKSLDSCMTYFANTAGPNILTSFQKGKHVPVGWVKSVHQVTELTNFSMKLAVGINALVGTAITFTASILLYRRQHPYLAIAAFIILGGCTTVRVLSIEITRRRVVSPLQKIVNEFIEIIKDPKPSTKQKTFDFTQITQLRNEGIAKVTIFGWKLEQNLLSSFTLWSQARCSNIYTNPACELLNDSLHAVSSIPDDVSCSDDEMKHHLTILGAAVKEFHNLRFAHSSDIENPDILMEIGKKYAFSECSLIDFTKNLDLSTTPLGSVSQVTAALFIKAAQEIFNTKI